MQLTTVAAGCKLLLLEMTVAQLQMSFLIAVKTEYLKEL